MPSVDAVAVFKDLITFINCWRQEGTGNVDILPFLATMYLPLQSHPPFTCTYKLHPIQYHYWKSLSTRS